jgi:uncharacterized membrane protein YjjP (DUF1212 family)
MLAVQDQIAANSFEERADFLVLLARQLHESGTTAARLENALDTVGRKLGLDADVWSSPTAIILSLTDTADNGRRAARNLVRVLRLSPGGVDLRTLCAVDDIAERVIAGELNAESGARALILAGAPVRAERLWLETTGGFMLASAGVAALLNAAWVEIAITALIGAVLGALHITLGARRRFANGLDALCAIVAAFLVTCAAHFFSPIDYRRALLASVIVVIPGLSITSAAAEIATEHLVSGTARMAGAFATLLKLAFGALVGAEAAKILGMTPIISVASPSPEWVAWTGLLVCATSFAVLFKALPKDFPLAIGAAILGYGCTRVGGDLYGKEFGVFFAGLVVALTANLYARVIRRPGALIRLPGIILLVPGSVGFKSLFFVFQKDVFLGLDTAISMLLLVVSLVAGLLLASTIVPPRHSL